MDKAYKTPYVRDVFLSNLINGARFTEEGYPIVEEWMVATEIPSDIYQWDCRNKIKDSEKSKVAMSFYCNDKYFQPVINDPNKYIEELRKYMFVIGLDASPYDDMPPIVQCSQIFVNLATTYHFGRRGLKVVPNVRIGHEMTYSSLKAYPKNRLIAIGTYGCVRLRGNRKIFAEQLKIVVDELSPSGILVYGPTPNEIFSYVVEKGIPIYPFKPYMQKRWEAYDKGTNNKNNTSKKDTKCIKEPKNKEKTEITNTMTKEKLKELMEQYFEMNFKYKRKWYSITHFEENGEYYISFCEFYKDTTDVSTCEELMEVKRNGVTVWEMLSSIDDDDILIL